jgi:hypothetical protein
VYVQVELDEDPVAGQELLSIGFKLLTVGHQTSQCKNFKAAFVENADQRHTLLPRVNEVQQFKKSDLQLEFRLDDEFSCDLHSGRMCGFFFIERM